MKKKCSGQITVEAAIITPIIMMVIASLMYFTFYTHDVVKIKGYAYSVGNKYVGKGYEEFEKNVKQQLKETPLFLMKSDIACTKGNGNYEIQILLETQKKISWMEELLKIDDSIYKIKFEKDMDSEILYIGRAICDELKNKKEH